MAGGWADSGFRRGRDALGGVRDSGLVRAFAVLRDGDLGWRAPYAGAWLADAPARALEANDRWERLAGELRAECAELRAENARMRERDAQREAKFEQWMSVGDLSYPIGAVLDGSLKVPRDPLNYISERQGLYSRRSITNLS